MQVNKRSDTKWVSSRFDRIAPWYMLFQPLFLVPRKARLRAVQALSLKSGDQVLCVGCGNGPGLPALSTGVGAAGAVVGVDLSRRMLDSAQSLLNEQSITNVELLHVDLFQHKPRALYQKVFFEFSLSSFGDPAAALKHCWNLLAPGGLIVVVDGRLPPRFAWLSRPLMPLIRWFLEQTVLGDPDMQAMEHMETLGVPVDLEWFRAGTYYVAKLQKPIQG